jgi:predicted  nucleic acid-binding Zn-ribbon protein
VRDLFADLTAERNSRAQEKADLEKKLTDAQSALSSANNLKAASDSALTSLQNTFAQYKVESDKKMLALQSQAESLLKTITAANSKYAALVKKYNALAKKFKQPTIKG